MTKSKNIECYELSDFKGGWFIGNFEPSLLKTEKFEASVKNHPKGEQWPKHYHKIATEFNYIFEGKVEISGKIYKRGQIFVVPPEYVVDPNFLEDCIILCIKTPGPPDDKYIVD